MNIIEPVDRASQPAAVRLRRIVEWTPSRPQPRAGTSPPIKGAQG